MLPGLVGPHREQCQRPAPALQNPQTGNLLAVATAAHCLPETLHLPEFVAMAPDSPPVMALGSGESILGLLPVCLHPCEEASRGSVQCRQMAY